jgi:hypothetical protein
MSSTNGNGTGNGAGCGGGTVELHIPSHGRGRLKAPWAKGQSGNPSGGSQLLHEVRSRCLALIRRRGFDDLEQLLADRDSMVRLAALKLLFEYGLGKPAVLPESAWAPDPDEDV